MSEENKTLSKAQKKKLKEKQKKEEEMAALAKELGEEVPEKAPVEEESKEEKKGEEGEEEKTDTSGLSKAQKKKLKEKEKKAAQATQGEAEAEKPAAKGPAGKGKISAAAKKIQEAQKKKQEEQAELARLEEEARKKEEEEERIFKEKQEEEKKRKEEQKKLKAADKISKKEAKKQAELEAARKRREAMLGQGLIAGADSDSDDDNKKSHVVKRNKDKKKKKKPEEKKEEAPVETPEVEETKEEETPEEKVEEKKVEPVGKKQEVEEEEDALDDWDAVDTDAIAEKVKKESGVVNTAKEEDRVLEDSDEEEKRAVQKAKKQGKKGGKKQAQEEEAGIFEVENNAESAEQRKARQQQRRKELVAAQQKAKKQTNLRLPILCIMGHVDTGKTKILDKLRRTNVQGGEAGGITQQIGATWFPEDNLRGHLDKCKGKIDLDLQIPGFLVIDTPGHESFTNLRSRGSSLCDFAILVVDLMHGLENQTIESMELLRTKKVPFVVALNKIDRIFDWKPHEFMNSQDTMAKQKKNCLDEFEDRLGKVKLAFAEQGLNTALYYEGHSEDDLLMVPTSAITGEGLPDLMSLIMRECQTKHKNKLREKDEFQCTVLEVKVIEGLGTTIDVVLVNGTLHVGDTIILQGFNGPIVTKVRALLTPQPMREMRVKAEYIHHNEIKGSMGIKISAPELENALAGSELYRSRNDEETQDYVEQIQDDICDILDQYVDRTSDGVCVQASTLGSLEALLEFLKKDAKIPVSSISIGPVHKKDVMRAMKAVNTSKEVEYKEYASILAFDVKVTPEARQFADENGIKVFTANIIYNLFDMFKEYVEECERDRKKTLGDKAVFPAILEIVKDAVFRTAKPIVLGVNVKSGVLKIGTPLCVPDKGDLKIGRVTSMQVQNKDIQEARSKHGNVAIKIEGYDNVEVGKSFEPTSQLASLMNRDSIDALKQFFKDEMTKDDWRLVIQLKKMFNIL